MSEFERLRRMPLTGSMSDARSGGNARLNRYFNVLPFDANRVRLENGTSDYINASLLTSPPEEQPSWEYIATQVRFLHTKLSRRIELLAVAMLPS